ncbi:energy transducer TonB [bacterium]|nr:energy transducer TonB [bacterium]
MMKMRNLMMIVAAMMMLVAGSVFAGEISNVDSEYCEESAKACYKAPVPVNMERPERVFYDNQREVEGYVTVSMLVNKKGDVEEAKVLYRTSKYAVDSAIDAVDNWKFEPAELEGEMVDVWVTYNLPFGLDLEIYEDTDVAHNVVFEDDQILVVQR